MPARVLVSLSRVGRCHFCHCCLSPVLHVLLCVGVCLVQSCVATSLSHDSAMPAASPGFPGSPHEGRTVGAVGAYPPGHGRMGQCPQPVSKAIRDATVSLLPREAAFPPVGCSWSPQEVDGATSFTPYSIRLRGPPSQQALTLVAKQNGPWNQPQDPAPLPSSGPFPGQPRPRCPPGRWPRPLRPSPTLPSALHLALTPSPSAGSSAASVS